MPIKADDYSNVCVLSLNGDLAADTSKEVRRTVEERIEQRRIADFVLDFEKADFIDSEGLETLLWLKRRCEDLFGQIKLVNLDENCRKILEITRLEHRFECHGDLAGALKTMR
ncbi:MAG: anti-sigma factor antagonist [Phycisphaerales bacterium]|jgi:anti-anti-sigma factor|nr:anti-sigma factor antagonist [Phycisphaerales bacterium]MEA2733682.1 anti-sigma factor antagonist [Humisphaera sp.]